MCLMGSQQMMRRYHVPTEHQRAPNWNLKAKSVGFAGEGKIEILGEKVSGAEKRTNNKLRQSCPMT